MLSFYPFFYLSNNYHLKFNTSEAVLKIKYLAFAGKISETMNKYPLIQKNINILSVICSDS